MNENNNENNIQNNQNTNNVSNVPTDTTTNNQLPTTTPNNVEEATTTSNENKVEENTTSTNQITDNSTNSINNAPAETTPSTQLPATTPSTPNNEEAKPNNNDNTTTTETAPKTKDKKKTIFIAVAIIIAIIILVLVSRILFGGSHNNNTGSKEYKAKDVDLTCIYSSDDAEKNVTVYSDFIFNYKSKGNKSYNYQLKMYNKKINTYKNGVTDEVYKQFMQDLFEDYCYGLSGNDCTKSHVELGMTDFGWDTTIDRMNNKITVTYNNVYGIGQTATSKDIAKMKKDFEKEDYKCN